MTLMIVLRMYYTKTMPELPDSITGHTVAITLNHLKTVYLTPAEQKLLYGTYVLVGLAVAIFLAGYIRSQRNPS